MIARAFAGAVLALFASLAHAQSTIGFFPVGRGTAVVVNPTTHRAYVADSAVGGIDVVEGTSVVATIPLPHTPTALAVNAPFNLVYAVNNDDGFLSIIDGNTNSVSNFPINARPPVVVNELRNRVMVAASNRSEMLSMEGHGNNINSISVGGAACDAVLNVQTDQLYVVHCFDPRGIDPGRVSLVDLNQGGITDFTVPGTFAAIGLNRLTNRAYVVSEQASPWLTVIDGNSKTAHAVTAPPPMVSSRQSVMAVVNPSVNRVYITRGYEIVVFDAGSETFSLLTYTAEPIRAIAVDEQLARVLVIDGYRRLVSIDAANRLNVTDSGVDAVTMGIDSTSHRMYAVGSGGVVLGLDFIAPTPRNYQGLWWNPSESGWGVALSQQGDTWFAAWYTYDEFGHATWFVMPNGKANVGSGQGFGGTLYRVTGSPFSGTFDPSSTHATVVGFVTFQFSDASNGTMEATVNSARITKAITRQVWGPQPSCEYSYPLGGLPNFTELWWLTRESGWGVFLTHQGDNIFLAWFTYDTDGTPMWLVGSNIVKTGDMTYSGTLYRTNGPPFTASPWNSSNVSVMPVGTATLSFTSLDFGAFSYTVGGVSGLKAITREMFSSPQTYCR